MTQNIKILLTLFFVTVASCVGLGFIQLNSVWVPLTFQEAFAFRILSLVLIVNVAFYFTYAHVVDEAIIRRRTRLYLGFLVVVVLLIFGFAPAVEHTKYRCYTESALFYGYAEQCYDGISVETDDPQLCKDHVKNYSSCHTYFAGKLGTAYECPDFTKDVCDFWSATGAGGISLCASLPQSTGNIGRNSCYYELALENNDSATCALIEPDNASGSENKQGYCYLLIAEKTNNPALCDKIVNATRRYECLRELGVSQ